MAQSFAKILLHAVFSTKDRRPFLRDEPFREELHRYLGGILTNLGCQSLIIGGVEDHVHLLFALSRTATVADVVEESKRGSSVWLKTKSPALADFAWQNRAERDSQKAEPLPEGQRRMALAMATAFSPSASRRWMRRTPTSPGRRNIIARFRFRMNSASCSGVTKWNSTNGICGIDETSPREASRQNGASLKMSENDRGFQSQ